MRCSAGKGRASSRPSSWSSASSSTTWRRLTWWALPRRSSARAISETSTLHPSGRLRRPPQHCGAARSRQGWARRSPRPSARPRGRTRGASSARTSTGASWRPTAALCSSLCSRRSTMAVCRRRGRRASTTDAQHRAPWRLLRCSHPVLSAHSAPLTHAHAPCRCAAPLLYQRKPILRVVMPGSVPPTKRHCDADYYHDANEINFWVPLTRVWGSNTLWSESAPGARDFAPFEARPGEAVRFYGAPPMPRPASRHLPLRGIPPECTCGAAAQATGASTTLRRTTRTARASRSTSASSHATSSSRPPRRGQTGGREAPIPHYTAARGCPAHTPARAQRGAKAHAAPFFVLHRRWQPPSRATSSTRATRSAATTRCPSAPRPRRSRGGGARGARSRHSDSRLQGLSDGRSPRRPQHPSMWAGGARGQHGR
jgi:hypothetical protein